MTIDTNQFGYDLIRNDILQDILGVEHDTILYWVGKSLARKYPLETTDQLIDFFARATWGELTLVKERRKCKIYELTGEWMGKQDKRCYQLEAGFLAQQTEASLNVIAGTTSLQKNGVVVLTITYEPNDNF